MYCPERKNNHKILVSQSERLMRLTLLWSFITHYLLYPFDSTELENIARPSLSLTCDGNWASKVLLQGACNTLRYRWIWWTCGNLLSQPKRVKASAAPRSQRAAIWSYIFLIGACTYKMQTVNKWPTTHFTEQISNTTTVQ